MLIFNTIAEIRNYLITIKKDKKIGLVPTMGALHDGHAALIDQSVQDNDITICSIFVNPIQFNNSSDLEKYPRTLDADAALLSKHKCDVLFAPSAQEMYPNGMPQLTIDFGYQNSVMEGSFRPGHFSGVGVVVAKLFNIIQPQVAYFGQKDFQQCLVVKQLARELSFPLEIKIVPTLREKSGLAMSSRNRRLTEKQLETAPKLYEILSQAAKDSKHESVEHIKSQSLQKLLEVGFNPEYFEFVDFETGVLCEELIPNRTYGICTAAFLGEVRLIDNIIFNA